MLFTGIRPTNDAGGNPVVSSAQMTAQLRLDDPTELLYIADLVDAAAEYAEQAMDTSLITRTCTVIHYQPPMYLTSVPVFTKQVKLFLPRGPVASITSVVDAISRAVTFTHERQGTEDYAVLTGTFTMPITVTYAAGWGTAAQVPADIRLAIRTHVVSLWENRASVSDTHYLPVPHSLEEFYAKRRRTSSVA